MKALPSLWYFTAHLPTIVPEKNRKASFWPDQYTLSIFIATALVKLYKKASKIG